MAVETPNKVHDSSEFGILAIVRYIQAAIRYIYVVLPFLLDDMHGSK